MTTTAQEFFDGLPGRVDPARLEGISSTYLFDVTGAGVWTVGIADRAICQHCVRRIHARVV